MTCRPPTGALLDPGLHVEADAVRSARFGDVYFSVEGGAAEAEHVFLQGTGLPEAWRNKKRFTIAELGFGSGLNFLMAWTLWRRTADPEARLDYVSVEGFPLAAEDISAGLSGFSQIAAERERLIAAYPLRMPGFHQRTFDGGRVTLTLLFGEAQAMLSELTARADAWFLDGFAPAKNPDMWTEGVFRQIARLSAPGARLATFTVAGAVRRGLQAVGFEVEKRPGFGRKRECLRAVFSNHQKGTVSGQPRLPFAARVRVTGQGIAGRALCRALQARGFEAMACAAADTSVLPAASEIPVALVAPRIASPRAAYGRFMTQAFSHAVSAYEENTGLAPWAGERGALRLCKDEDEFSRQRALLTEGGWPADFARPVDAAEASDIAGITVERPGIWFPTAGLISTDKLPKLDVVRNGDADARILACGAATRGLLPDARLPLVANRGQIALLPPTEISEALRVPLSFGGHLTPAQIKHNGQSVHVLGSTYARWETPDFSETSWRDSTESDQAECLQRLAGGLPGLAQAWSRAPLSGWAGLRATTPDHLPIAGPVPDAEATLASKDIVEAENLFVLTGLGSRGFQTAWLCADVIAAMLAGAPLPVPISVMEALLPGRFLLREIRRA